ncbi:hypothetical protein, partial [Streptomyces rhizosphaericus]|uniref:hypothetical protein n=1 Tax=Streptomyces rhizosphaericus TaxID=114699 RepID=UPI003B8A7E10
MGVVVPHHGERVGGRGDRLLLGLGSDSNPDLDPDPGAEAARTRTGIAVGAGVGVEVGVGVGAEAEEEPVATPADPFSVVRDDDTHISVYGLSPA